MKIKITKTWSLTALAFTAGVCGCSNKNEEVKNSKPNILLILADDLGYSDLGCYGGEVQTPNLDKLAANGVRFSRFYNAGRSCPSRASLLTGLYPHQAGIGRMTFDDHLPGYRGTMTHNGVTIAEVLKKNGYQTGMIGKWHVAETPLRPDQREWLAHHVQYDEFASKENYPTHRGFNDFYGTIYGVVDYFDPFSLVNGEAPVNVVPNDYYSTIALSDSAVSYINRYSQSENPFFIYLAYHSPHWPLHALEEDIKKYEEVYRVGWEAIRQARYERMKKLSIFNDQSDFLSDRQSPKEWETNPDHEWDAHAMAVHAAMIDRMDQGIGQVLKALEKSGKLENTLILFMSDNGCSPEICQNYPPGENDRPDMMRDGTPIIYPKQKEVLPGQETTYASIGPEWANVANTPFRFWKAKMYEGGICTPMIAHWPAGIKVKKGTITNEACHIIDVMATSIELSGAEYPKKYAGNDIIPLEGKSIIPILEKGKRNGHKIIGFEHFNEKALMSDDGWKIIQPGKKAQWELYNLNEDRSELKNLADKYPDKVAQMVKEYQIWAEKTMVLPAPN
ncbi:arylsulfatase [Massilibacteroides sp.]|uniref:arylsulfatase n=1 Tax=Massilibacteroides sp. TaxID=2034766 RepID=UPI00260D0B3A|nr:arylsulfatase [Massilibacteroides sp.]MDD4515886.1 arylsulfatase [Massilibacteroides sp.]